MAVDDAAAALSSEYAVRREMIARRCHVTLRSFGYSSRLASSPEVARDFCHAADELLVVGRDGGGVTATSARCATTADLALAARRVTSGACGTFDANVKKVLIGAVPDRGGRPDGKRNEAHMPAFTARAHGVGSHLDKVDHGGRGRGGGGRGGGRPGRGKR